MWWASVGVSIRDTLTFSCVVSARVHSEGIHILESLTRARLGRPGRALAVALPAVGIVALGVLVVAPRPSQAVAVAEAPFEETAPRSVVARADLARADLARAGLDAEVLAASGLGPDSVSQIIGALALESDFGLDRVRLAARDLRRASSDLAALERRVRSGEAARDEVARVSDMREEERRARLALESARAGMHDFVASVMDDQGAIGFRTILSQRELGVSVPYTATELSASERVTLRDALSMERFAITRDLAVDEETAAFLASIRNRPEVIAAREGLTRLEEVRMAFESAVLALDG